MADLKPMELGEILDGALTLFRRHFGLFVRLGVLALWLPASLNIYIQLTGGGQQHLGLTFITTLLQYFAGLFLTAGAIRIIADSYLGRATTLQDAVSLGLSKIMPLFGVGLAKGLLVGLVAIGAGVVGAVGIPALVGGNGGIGGLLFFVVLMLFAIWAVVFVACGYAVTTQIVVLEPLKASLDALGRSWELTRGFKRKVFNIAVVAGIIFYVPFVGVAGAAAALAFTNPFWAQVLAVLNALLPMLLAPILSCVFTLMYYDLRIRREGFDLQVLGQQMGMP